MYSLSEWTSTEQINSNIHLSQFMKDRLKLKSGSTNKLVGDFKHKSQCISIDLVKPTFGVDSW